jgi:F0F1-type ATP synthase assembly protein I
LEPVGRTRSPNATKAGRVERDDEPEQGLGAWDLVGLGGFNVACLLAGLVLGWLVDGWLHTSPAGIMGGIAAGIAVGVAGSWLRVRKFLQS